MPDQHPCQYYSGVGIDGVPSWNIYIAIDEDGFVHICGDSLQNVVVF